MKHPLFINLIALASACSFAFGQQAQHSSMLNSPAYEAAAAPLRSAPPRQYNFSKAVLSEVMRLMAEDAGIGFFGLPDGTDGADRLVTFTLTAAPFVALETLAKANGVSLIHDNGIWYLRPANDQELIGRIYEINYNAQEVVTKNSQGGGGGGGFSSSGAGATSGAGGGGASAGLNLQGSPDFFVTEPSRILEDIQNILDIPTTGGGASFAPTASVDNLAQLSVAGLPGNQSVAPRTVVPTGGDRAAEGDGGSKVIWNSDSNTLYVVATRQQHQWIEAYLESADRPQPMIAVEVKFIETSRDPSSDFGIDWNGVLGDEGLDVTLSDNSGPIDLNQVGDYALPTAILSYSDLTWKLRALYEDRNTETVSFPRMVTLDNREVSFRSVINQPVLGSSASASLGAGGTQTSSIEYLPIGTVINILPKRMAGEKILLNVSVTVSDIVGTEVIGGNPFPIATSRVYTAPLTVKSGYTVAISGLDAARTEESERGVPVLGKLPVLGAAFKNRRRDRSNQHLMMLITPIALDSGTHGLSEKPTIREPWEPKPGAGKVPMAEGRVRTNADLEGGMVPIEDIPEFEEPARTPEARKARHTFGRKPASTPAPLVARPIEAKEEERFLGAAASVPEKAVAEKAVAEKAVAEKTVAEAPERVARLETTTPTPVPEQKKSAADAADDLATVDRVKIDSIREGMEEVRGTLAGLAEGNSQLSQEQARQVTSAYGRTERLLEQFEEVRGDSGKPLAGDLGDLWWDLINLKTEAGKLDRRFPPVMATNLSGD